MRTDEAFIQASFCAWLDLEGWTLETPAPEIAFVDVFATRAGETIIAEVKGRTASTGLDIDTAYGQLLRRMPAELTEGYRFGLVVPLRARAAALRVPERVRLALGIEIFLVSENGDVHQESADS